MRLSPFTTGGVYNTIKLSFFSHVVFRKSDAERLGVVPGADMFQLEVGFANLAIGMMAFFAVAGITAK